MLLSMTTDQSASDASRSWWTPEQRAKKSAQMRRYWASRPHPRTGEAHTEETRVSQSQALRDKWADPGWREARLERRATRLGTTVEALMRPKAWAPLGERRRTYLGLLREGKTVEEIMKLYPNEDYNIVHRVHSLEQSRKANELGDLL